MTRTEPEESSRMWASASFVGVLIVIGLPLWWKTTEVYRVTLPYEQISSFNSEKHIITTELTLLASDEPTAADMAGMIEHAFEKSDVIKLKINKAVLNDELHHTLNTVADDQEAMEVLAETFGLKDHNHFYVVQRKPLYRDVWMSTERALLFRDSKAAQTVIQVLKEWVYQTSVLKDSKAERSTESARRVRFPAGAGYHVVLSVVHPRPDLLNLEFNAAEAVEDFIGTFVDELSVLHNFTLKSQWLHLLEFDFQAREVKDDSEWGRHFAVRQDRLHLLLTRLEERLATRVSELPTINLVLYALPCEKAPLKIYDVNDNPVLSPVEAFMSPKWGGVYIGSPAYRDCRFGEDSGARSWRPPVRLVMGTLLAQLRPLLGIVDTDPIEGASLEPLRSVEPRKWEVDNLLRIRTLEQLASAELTLQSLAQLLGEISNIVITDEVGASITTAVEDIEIASVLLARGELVGAYNTSLDAFTAAEAAFTDPSLLALLYFPDDQKYAIYIPLFLPIMFPVILSLKNLLLWFRNKPAAKQKTD